MTAPALPAFRAAARACKSPGCPNVVSVADVDGYCVHCHADPTTFKDGSPRLYTEKPCAKCGVNPRQYANMPYCRECRSAVASENRRKRRHKAGQMEMGL